jgi:hypothetical protein
MSRCAETVEDENCLWKQMEKRKAILLCFFELLSILSLVASFTDARHHRLRVCRISFEKTF